MKKHRVQDALDGSAGPDAKSQSDYDYARKAGVLAQKCTMLAPGSYGESKVILASPQGILRYQRLPKHFGFSSDIRGLFQLGLHGTALIGFVQIINRNYIRINSYFTRGIGQLVFFAAKNNVMIGIFRSTELRRLAFGRPAVSFLKQGSSA